MEPVPWQLKIAFHFFGFGSLILGMVLFASTFASELCVSVFFLLFFMGTSELKSRETKKSLSDQELECEAKNRKQGKKQMDGEGMQGSCTLYFKGSIG